MRASTAMRRALAGGAAVLVALPLAPGGALATETSSGSGDADVRLVVLTSTRAAGTKERPR